MPVGKFKPKVERPAETIAEDFLRHYRHAVRQRDQSQNLHDRNRMHAGIIAHTNLRSDGCEKSFGKRGENPAADVSGGVLPAHALRNSPLWVGCGPTNLATRPGLQSELGLSLCRIVGLRLPAIPPSVIPL